MNRPVRIAFTPLTREDLPVMAEWLSRPHVAEWWDSPGSAAELEEEYGPAIDGTSSTRAYFVTFDGRPSGFIQAYSVVDSHADGWWLDEHDPGMRGIDQFLAHPEQLGRGLGTAMIRAFVDEVFADPAVTRIQTDPDPDNARAIRCYEKSGFRTVRVVETPDGPALLMYRDRS